ncbi:TROVE domain protein [Necator americanus]|uniref:TROVE domain protein n=1 Tax=Necator americanus TaxID=51031 RepID=W2T4P4_NECAM|nr:TROVE domain protein [Necator americanus]ETN77000.1 TROVE domain protein [Necator americanus]
MADEDRESPVPSEESFEIPDRYMCEVLKCEEQFRNLGIGENLPRQMMKTRPDEVRNTAGGFVFPVNDETRVRRFIILGTSGGTYYSTEKELTMDNVKALIDIIERGRGSLILKEIYEISLAGRNPKQDPLLMALALCARYHVCDSAAKVRKPKGSGDAPEQDPVVVAKHKYLNELHKSAFAIVNDVCRIPTHLFTFVKYCEMISQSTQPEEGKKSSGWGRLMRRTIQDWYAQKSPQQLAMHLTKYPQRGGWSHRDLFRLAHPTLKEKNTEDSILEYEQLYHFAVKGELKTRKRNIPKEEADLAQPATKYSALQMDVELESRALKFVETVLALKNEKDEGKIVEAIKTYNLVREHIPTDMLNSVPIWQALLAKMPMTAMIRNLGKMQSIGALTNEHRDAVVSKLTNESELKRAKIHPIQVLLAKTVYQAGHGDKGSLKWEVDKKIDTALEEAFYKSFVNAPPTNKRFCFAFDVSGSMCCNISGTMLSCRTASAALSLVSLKNEKTVECVGFCDHLVELPFNGDWTISKIENYVDGMEFGATDCALPMLWAWQKKKKFDVFVVYTDCETFFGGVHPYEALRRYRETSGITDAKLVVMGMTSTGFTIADPEDAGMIDIVGFDSAVPTLLADFVNGKV